MPLVSIKEYRERFYSPDSRPCQKTIYRWIKAGELPAQLRGGKFYIDTDNIRKQTGNSLADRILNKHLTT